MKKIFKITACAALVFGLAGCAHKVGKYDDFNKTDAEWLEKISKHLQKDELDKADAAYISLYSEHISSELLRPASLALSRAHAMHREYKIANYYIDEFNKLFGTAKNQDWCAFMKLRNDYYALAVPQRNQALLLKAIAEADEFSELYPKSAYLPMAQSIRARLELARYLMDEKILKLYQKMGHTKSVEAIQQKLDANDLAGVPYIAPDVKWYRKIFE